jgi:hypothetical protein
LGQSSPTAFGQAFKLQHGLQVIISTAARSGAPIWPDYAAAALIAAFPDGGQSPDELKQAIIQAALDAGVPVRTNSAATLAPSPARRLASRRRSSSPARKSRLGRTGEARDIGPI